MKKKLLSSLLAMCMVMSLIPATAFAAGEPAAPKFEKNAYALEADGTAIVKLSGDVPADTTYKVYDKAADDSGKAEISNATLEADTSADNTGATLKLTLPVANQPADAENPTVVYIAAVASAVESATYTALTIYPNGTEFYTIKFSAGTDASGEMADVAIAKKVDADTEYTLPAGEAITFTPPTGKVFDAWTVDPSVSNVSIADGKLTIGSAVETTNAITVTATWKVDQDQADVDAAKATLAGETWKFASETANTSDAVKAEIENQLGTLITDTDIQATVTMDADFTAAVDGDQTTPAGTAVSFKFTVELSKNGKTATTDTITGAITAKAYVADQDQADVDAAKETVAGETWEIASETANTSDAVKAEIENQLGTLITDTDIQATVTMDADFTAAVDGDQTTPAGTAGSFKFTVELSKNGKTATTDTITGAITAKAYVADQDQADVDAAKETVAGETWEIASETANTSDAVKAEIENQLGTLITDTDIQATVTMDADFTAAVDGDQTTPAGTAGSFKFTVELSKNGKTATTDAITGAITAKAYVAPDAPAEDVEVNLGTVNVNQGTASQTVANDKVTEVLDSKDEDAKVNLVFDLDKQGETITSTEATLPKATVETMAGKTNVTATFKTAEAEVTLTNDAVKQVKTGAGDGDAVLKITDIASTVSQTGKPQGENINTAYDVSVVKGSDKTTPIGINNLKEALPLRLKISGSTDDKSVTVYYVNDSGEWSIVSGATVENGWVSFTTTHLSKYVVTIGTDYTITIDSDTSKGYTAQAQVAGGGTISENINVVFELMYEGDNGAEYTYTVQSAKSGSTTISGIDSEGNAPTKVTAWVVRGDFDPAHFQANFTNGTVKVFNRAEA